MLEKIGKNRRETVGDLCRRAQGDNARYANSRRLHQNNHSINDRISRLDESVSEGEVGQCHC